MECKQQSAKNCPKSKLKIIVTLNFEKVTILVKIIIAIKYV